MLFNILTITALLSAASAVPLAAPQVGPGGPPLGPDYKWKIENWNVKPRQPDDGTVGYNFDISGPLIKGTDNSPEIPAFNASCISATGEGGEYVPCAFQDGLMEIGTRNMTAALLPHAPAGSRIISVSYQFMDRKDSTLGWNFTASGVGQIEQNEFEIMTKTFTTVDL